MSKIESSSQVKHWRSFLTHQHEIIEYDATSNTFNNKHLILVYDFLRLSQHVTFVEVQNLVKKSDNDLIDLDIFLEDAEKLILRKTDSKLSEDYHHVMKGFQTPADKIVQSLGKLRLFLQTKTKDQNLFKELNFAINNINHRSIYRSNFDEYLTKEISKGNSEIIDWLNEYSEAQTEQTNIGALKLLKQNSSMSPNGRKSKGDIPFLKRSITIRSLLSEYEQYEEFFEDSLKQEFNLFNFSDAVGRERTLPLLAINMLINHGLESLINEQKYALFLGQVYSAYRRDVSYHNDLHGIDVAQVANLFLNDGDLIQIAELDNIDILAFLTAGLCHDLGHDGFTNGYHQNAISDRAIRTNDVSVQESYHVAEAFAIIKKQEFNFLETLKPEEFRILRKRMIGCILATDMAKHFADVSQLKSLAESKQIKNGQNQGMIINKENEASLFKSQQFIMELCLHACDLSQQARNFEVSQKWCYLVFEEFFNQGDVEVDQGLPISFYCNRKTTKVPETQPGFINGIVLPLWTTLVDIMPGMSGFIERAKSNSIKWAEYEESEEDKKIYGA
ncbi:3 5-cyclic nucleotide phosphodiesterase family protein [Stylonychia lemnae]|uniref:Phosphodiesterase n=1 Tax=Stylonychia lemnae TaxID=5949 RepID=A0A077ZXQ6_STYLE|nr:3 5-cyclic nucleotide phosphodiesterase family protein [Stylonychia lemnae]|eukprot:CDW73306.1 3 5-cyclic nucleotide phosphodiesterase family protein [Stylonychia lemnae]